MKGVSSKSVTFIVKTKILSCCLGDISLETDLQASHKREIRTQNIFPTLL